MATGVFISSTGTGAGKTFVARGLARAWVEAGFTVAGLKPIETGCTPEPLDAVALATAGGAPELAREDRFYRVEPPVSPYAATLMGRKAPEPDGLVAAIRDVAGRYSRVVVEGAGGLLVPLDERRDTSHLVRALGYPVVLVAPNRLGVLSHVLALAEVAQSREIHVAAIVLSEPDSAPDASSATNAAILRSRLTMPVLSFPYCEDDDSTLADAARACGILESLGSRPREGETAVDPRPSRPAY